MKKILIITCLIILSVISKAQELTILHTNDMHSKLTGYGPESEYTPLTTNDDGTLGGFARLATLFKQVKEKSPGSTLILDDGDFLMGTLFHVAEAETGFQLNLMKKIGYDYITLGNHEFEFGPKNLSNTLKSAEKIGGFPQIVASNLVFNTESAEDDDLETFFKNQSIKPYVVITKNGLKIGIFGLMGIDAASVVTASKPVTFSKPEKVAEKMTKYLKSVEKVDLVILLSHGGVVPNQQNTGFIGEDIDLAKKVPLIDIIISGHTHVSTPNYIKSGNTYIVQTGEYVKNLGEINLKFDKAKIADFKFHLIPVDDQIIGDQSVVKEIEKQKELVDSKFLINTGLKYAQIVGKTDFDLKINFNHLKNSNLGPFLVDASQYYLKSTNNDVDFSLVASGTIRENILKGKNGILTVSDIFRVMSLGEGFDKVPGYPLAKIYITGHEVKELMEALTMSRSKGGDGFIYFSGIKTTINSGKGFLKKVQKIEINGKEIDLSKKSKQVYSLAANTYLLSFIGRIKKMSFGLLKVVPKDKNGKIVTDMKNQMVDIDPAKEGTQEAKEWIAVIEFMKSFGRDVNGIPIIPESYKKSDESVIDMAK